MHPCETNLGVVKSDCQHQKRLKSSERPSPSEKGKGNDGKRNALALLLLDNVHHATGNDGASKRGSEKVNTLDKYNDVSSRAR